MTTTEMAAFRCCCIAFNAIFTENAATILCTILRKRDYQAITTLYGTKALIIACIDANILPTNQRNDGLSAPHDVLAGCHRYLIRS